MPKVSGLEVADAGAVHAEAVGVGAVERASHLHADYESDHERCNVRSYEP